MSSKSRRLLITCILSIAIGLLPTALIAGSENGYAAGYIVLPLLILEVLICVVLLLVGVVFFAQGSSVGPYVLISVLLIPLATAGSVTIAKQFEIGAYYTEPIRSFIPPVANKIVFKRDVSDREVQAFWHDVLSQPSPSGLGEDHIPGIQTISLGPDQAGSRTILFSFFDQASEEQKASVRERIGASPKVFQFLEGVEIFP